MAILNNLLKSKKLGEILVDSKMLNPTQLESALNEAKKRNMRLGTALVSLSILSEDDIINALSQQLSIKKIELSKIAIDPAIGKILPEALSKQFKMVAINLSDNILTVVISDPLNVFAGDALKKAVNYDIEIAVAREHEILRAIDFVYSAKDIIKADNSEHIALNLNKGPQKSTTGVNSATSSVFAAPAGDAINKEIIESEDINIIKLVNDIIVSASKNRASDIHIEPLEDEILIRERIDGELFEIKKLPKQFINPLIARIKIISNMDIAEKRNAQDSRFNITLSGKELDIRVSILPTINGEKAVLRILDKSSKINKISESSYIDDITKGKILKLINKKYGLFLITGPTGSGKTTTAYSILSELNKLNKNLVTVENPVEYKIKYINQVEANLKGGMSFADILRSVLRQDPDIILVGEIRDIETAKIAIQASLTGHFVISTLHTQDASSTISRLIDMQIEPFLIASAIVGIIGQRLLKKLCDKCKKPYEPDAELLKELGLPENKTVYFYKEKGCPECRGTGFKGRIPIYELLVPDNNIQKLILEKADASLIRNTAVTNGFITLRRYGIIKALEGLTAIEEVLQATQDI
ncbi:MAG: AAA family ATPase [Candidatus Acididesulfobacter guangdongensis]|uniref:AAA family ATPase n=1 Tax=Acididesulfobacter guangdongensis TaxID=2597225 RepID=A0A519BFN4_ACIG2|nr:MAG: AAA family ATPase [Candidatus Acididesulfobacter guangdongensis]